MKTDRRRRNASRLAPLLLKSISGTKTEGAENDPTKGDPKVDPFKVVKDTYLKGSEKSRGKITGVEILIFVSLLVIMSVGILHYLHRMAEQKWRDTNASIVESVRELNQKSSDFELALDQNDFALSDNHAKTEALLELKPAVERLSDNLEKLNQQLERVHNLAEINAALIKATEEKITELKKDLSRQVTHGKCFNSDTAGSTW